MAAKGTGHTKPACGACHDTGVTSHWDSGGRHDTPCPNGCKPPVERPACSLTEFGFIWGAMEVTRFVSLRGMVVLRVGSKGSKRHMYIYVSPKGRNLTAYPDAESVWLFDGRGGERLGRK